MSEINDVKVLKKRGRKPKVKTVEPQIVNDEQIESDKEVIITYLPLSLNDLENKYDDTSNIFIKSESQFKNDSLSSSEYKEKINLKLSPESETNTNINCSNGIYINKINIHNIEVTQNTKCWWCKNTFETPNVTLPEHYYNGTFYCIGNFCSYNCSKAHNIDLNDANMWKRESLINLMYYMTYGRHKEIDPAPSWLILKEFGGFMTINDFRKNFETNNSEYILLYPPLISRQMQIEESYKKSSNTNGPINKLDKLFSENTYSLKRSKPIESTQLNLEKTMGLKRKTKVI